MYNSGGSVQPLLSETQRNPKLTQTQQAFLWPGMCHQSISMFTTSTDCRSSQLAVSESLKCHWLLCVTLSYVTSERSETWRLAIPKCCRNKAFLTVTFNPAMLPKVSAIVCHIHYKDKLTQVFLWQDEKVSPLQISADSFKTKQRKPTDVTNVSHRVWNHCQLRVDGCRSNPFQRARGNKNP